LLHYASRLNLGVRAHTIMHRLGTIEEARAKVLADGRRCMERIRTIASTPFDDPDTAVEILQRVRSESYEDLNQIQHEHLILCAVEWLLKDGVCPSETEWHWNPRQTGDHTEPDLICECIAIILVTDV